MTNLEELKAECERLNTNIQHLLKDSGYENNGDLYDLELDRNDPDSFWTRDILEDALENLSFAVDQFQYIYSDVVFSGPLRKKENGRYECGGHELSSGSIIDALVPCQEYDPKTDKDAEITRWVPFRIEYADGRYYLVGRRDLSLDGLMARIRW